MKHYTFRLSLGLMALLLLNACLKDQSSVDYDLSANVIVDIPVLGVTGRLGDTITVTPTLTFKEPNASSAAYGHEWYVLGELVSTEPILRYVPTRLGNLQYSYFLVDRATGVRYTTPVGRVMSITSPYQLGWTVLYERDGASELGHVSLVNGEYKTEYDLYAAYNNGEAMGSQPLRLQDYQLSSGRGLFVIQHGGQGSIELNALSLQRQLVVSEAFTGGLPEDFAPVDFGFHYSHRSDILINHDGRVFTRSFAANALPYSYPWISTPMQYPGGISLTDIWDSWTVFSRISLTYDRLNKRVLVIQAGPPTGSGGVVLLPVKPNRAYPDDYTPLEDLGDWEYRWGGTFGDQTFYLKGVMLMQHPVDPQFHIQTFEVDYSANLTPVGRRTPFSGSALVREDSRFEAIKPREYIFFSSGSELHYYDAVTGETKHFVTLGSKITAIRANDQAAAALNTTLAVGLEDGTFALYDISDPALIAGQRVPLFEAGGFGKIVDMLDKGGRNTN